MGGFWLHPVSFFLTALVLLTGTQYEYYLMIRNTGVKPQMVAGIITGITAYTLSTLVAWGVIPKRSFLVLIPMILLIMILELYRKQEKPFDSLSHTFFSIIYSVVPFQCFPLQHFQEQA